MKTDIAGHCCLDRYNKKYQLSESKGKKKMGQVFIIGFSRTGSTLLQQILNNCTEIGILPEMHIYWPRWLHKDFATTVQKEIGEITDEKIDLLMELMYSKKLNGIFWKNIERFDLDIVNLKEIITASDRSIKSIFEALLETSAKAYNKKIMGAKFPVHFSYVNKLVEWYPNCRIIHTMRDPRAIYASQYRKHIRNNYSMLRKILTCIVQFVHVNFSYYSAVKLHMKMLSHENYYLFKYEDIILNPEKSLRGLCDFIGINFSYEMLNPTVFVNTSWAAQERLSGLHLSSLDLWKNKLPFAVIRLIELINGTAMKHVGYH